MMIIKKTNKSKIANISLSLNQDVLNELDRFAEIAGVSRSSLAKELLIDGLRRIVIEE
jgi:metal-responsive CopG/Arc/MetJ family transcriptional regulator